MRRYWKGDENLASEVGYRLAGSADLFEGDRRHPQASINFVTAHDGFTLHDLVSYGSKHNEANGEHNRDGADDNQSWNHGVEGETDDAGDHRAARAAEAQPAGHAAAVAGRADAARRRRDGAHPARQQQRLLPGQRAVLGRLAAWTTGRQRAAGVHAAADRAAPPPPGAAAAALLRRRLHLGLAGEGPGLAAAGRQRDDAARLAEAVRSRRWRSCWAATPSPCSTSAASAWSTTALLVLLNAAPRADKVHAAGRGRRRPPGCWRSTPPIDEPGRRPRRARTNTRSGARSMVVLRQPLRRQDGARGGGRARRGSSSSRRNARRRRAGVTVPLFSIRSATGWGLGEIPDLAKFATLGGARRVSRCCSCCPSTPRRTSTPARTPPAPGSRIDPAYLALDACEDFVAGGRPRRAARRHGGAHRRGQRRRRWSTGRAVRALKRAGIALAFERFLRDEWRTQSPRAQHLSAYMRANRRGWTTTRCSPCCTPSSAGAGSTGRCGLRDRDPGAIAAARRTHADALLQVQWLQWQLELQWRRARREASAASVELMGDLPFVVGLDSADVWANHSLFHLNQRLGTPPDDTSPDGQDWGLPVYDWARDGARRTSRGSAPAPAAPASSTACSASTTRSAATAPTRARRDGKPIGFAPSDEWEQVQLGEKLMRIMSRFAEVVAEDLGTVPPFLRPSLERGRRPRLPRAALGARRRQLPRSDRLAGDVGRDQRDPRHRHHRRLVRRADAGRTRGASPIARAGRARSGAPVRRPGARSVCWRRSTRRRRRWP